MTITPPPLPQSESEFASRGGPRLFLRRWEPPAGPPRGVAVLCHGGFEHGGRYGELAGRLGEAGFRCYAGDLRGCGRSGGLMGHVGSFDEYLDDLGAFLDRAAGESEGLPLGLVGHSMGGLLALMYLQERRDPRVRATVISGALLKLAFDPPAWKTAVGRGLAGVLPRLRLAHGLKTEHLSHDPEVVRSYDEDPLVFPRCSTRWYVAMVEAMARANAGPSPGPETLWVHGGDDRVNAVEGVQAFVRRHGEAAGRLTVYPGMYHEVFNEVDREQVLAEVVGFLSSRVLPGDRAEVGAPLPGTSRRDE